ncbi:DUF4920 domain-containing protein [Flavobacterium quisquiliarum]|jgi:hypothetical protein|uniref:DUF4920 domain-containing protein n=1 Tax=Flavobacterium quisquiliarum TaxID=1834436 RepID=A0ABV8W8D8_9FLAO|nr:DUF4920 domain-containing protein [Flavobacterium quisquiliarum]MBW1658673.1 DUF4920 domain-containing protein [Flavobacterium quisquiliarum]NWL01048.1 DUF4920 domain-containing protein [Flavobacterium collinsii]
MKLSLYMAALLLSVSSFCFAQEDVEKPSPPPGNALVGDYYGTDISEVSLKNAISVDKLEDKLKKEDRIENVAVKGEVTAVCPKRGCWISIKTEDSSSFFVKMKDYAFFVPTAAKGKNVVLEGVAEKKVTSVEELKHYAKDAKKSKAEIDAIKTPKEEIRFMANGIKVVN